MKEYRNLNNRENLKCGGQIGLQLFIFMSYTKVACILFQSENIL